MNDNTIQSIIVSIIPLLLAITLREAAHGLAAKRFGDNTAFMLGRITLNPLKHIDPIGTVIMPIALWVLSSGTFTFGYAKPVPVNFNNLHNPKRDMVWVAFAGPAVNLLQALIWGLIAIFAGGMGLSGSAAQFIGGMCQAGLWINVLLFVFNLLPLPPLDGGRIAVGLLPREPSNLLARIEPYGFYIVLALLVTNIIYPLWLKPVGGLTMGLIALLLQPFQMIFGA
ncbi:MAG: site-2 protease family protein [Brachymonas sp.]